MLKLSLVENLFAVACHDLVHTLADDIKLGLIGADGSDLVRRQMSGSVVFRAQFWNAQYGFQGDLLEQTLKEG